MYVCVPPFLTLLLYVPTGALIHDGAYPGSEANTKPPEMSTLKSNISAGPEDLVVSLTNATFPSVSTTLENKVMDSTAFSVKIFEPPPSKGTETEPPTGIPRMEPTGRNDALSPTPKPHNITLPPMDHETEFKTFMATSSIILSSTTGATNIPPEQTKNIIDVASTTVYTHSHQDTSKLMGSLSTSTSNPHADTALTRFTTDQSSTGPSDTLIPSTTKGVTSIQPAFTKNIINEAPTTVYTHSYPETTQPISSLSTATSKSQANTALPGLTTDWGSTGPSGTIIPSTTKGVTSIQPAFTKNVIDVAPTTVYTYSHQPISLSSTAISKPHANTALPRFTTDWGSTGPSGIIIPSTTKGVTSIQTAFTKNVIDVAPNTVYTHSHPETTQLISSLSTATSKPQAKTALPGLTTDQGSAGPSGTIIPSTTKGVTSSQPAFTKNVIDVAPTTVYTHSHQPISLSSTATSKPQANTALPGFTTDWGSKGTYNITMPSTTKGVTNIQPAFTKGIIDVAHTTVYTHNPQETSQLMSSSYIPTSNISSPSSKSAQVMRITTSTAMQETTWPTNVMSTTTREDTTTALLTANNTYPTSLPLKSKVSDPRPPMMTMAKTSVSFNSDSPGIMLPAITSTRKTLNVTGSCSPETRSTPMPPGTPHPPVPYSVTPPSPAPWRSTYSRIKADTSSTMETTEDQSLEITEIIEITDTISENTFHQKIAVSNSGGRIILRVTMKSFSTTNIAVVMRELLQQTCLLLDQEIPAEDVTVSWSSQKMFLPCVTVMGIGS